MSKIRILAVEDQPIYQATLFMITEKIGYELVGVVDNATDAIAQALTQRPDLILMDIQISGDKDGIETAQRLRSLYPCPLIFTTALADTDTIQRAKTALPYGYLVKPITAEKLQAAAEIAVYRFAQNETENNAMPDGQQVLVQDSFFIKDNNLLVKVPIKDILWAEADKDKYCKVITKDKVFFVRSPLKDIGDKLPPKEFVQIHRSIIAQLNQIQHINDFDSTLTIAGTELPVGKTFKSELINRLQML